MTCVSEYMVRGTFALSPVDTAQTAAQTMLSRNVDALPVCGNGRFLGMLTARDLAMSALAPGEARVGELMSADAVRCFEDEPVEPVLRRARAAAAHHVPVLDRTGLLVGMLLVGEQAVPGERN
jgi:CBS domain-containing protein